MPEKYDRCISDVKSKIKKGKISKTFKDKKTGKRKKTSAHAICSSTLGGKPIKSKGGEKNRKKKIAKN